MHVPSFLKSLGHSHLDNYILPGLTSSLMGGSMTPKECELYKVNAELTNHLMLVVFKSLSRKDTYAENVTLHPRAQSLEEVALQSLANAGFAKEDEDGYVLDWKKLRGRLANAASLV